METGSLCGSQQLVEVLTELGLDERAAEAYVLASAYISPVMVLGRESLEELKPLVTAVVRVKEYPDEKSWRLHARIADYTVLDFYGWATESGLKIVKALTEGRDPSQLLEERRERVERDRRRYWRILSEEGEVFLAYLDLPAMLAKHEGGRGAAGALLEALGDDLACCLAVVSAIVVSYEGS